MIYRMQCEITCPEYELDTIDNILKQKKNHQVPEAYITRLRRVMIARMLAAPIYGIGLLGIPRKLRNDILIVWFLN